MQSAAQITQLIFSVQHDGREREGAKERTECDICLCLHNMNLLTWFLEEMISCDREIIALKNNKIFKPEANSSNIEDYYE